MIEGLFRELDRKISGEWNEVARQVAESGDNDNLTDEMKTESILRQLTYSSVSLVAVLLDSRQGMSTPFIVGDVTSTSASPSLESHYCALLPSY
jgi:hypothetical protein